MATVEFPDGTSVEAVGIGERCEDRPDRDYGLYMDAMWEPTWNADVIDWEDYGLPADSGDAVQAIRKAFDRARRGERVEIGCIGGLGRTGTVLACMAILAGVAPRQAVEWVRDHYDPQAVETPEQEAWVIQFAETVGRAAK